MKTKLLRKIRKRYSIIEVNKLASDYNGDFKQYREKIGFPQYEVIDNDEGDLGSIDKFLKVFKTYDEALVELGRWIINDYGEKFRHRDIKEKKFGGLIQIKNKHGKIYRRTY